MEYYDSTPSRLNIKLQNIPLGRTTNNDYLRIYNGLNQTLPIMQHEFSNLKYRAKEFNNSMSIPQVNPFINYDFSNTFNYQINNSQRMIENNFGVNNNFNQFNMNNNNFVNYNNYRNYNNNYNLNQGNNIDKNLERDMLINQFQDLMEVCYEKLKQYKNENENLKMKIGKNINNNNKNMKEENEYINEENNDEEENENDYESPYLNYNFLKKDNLNMQDNNNKMKQISNLGKDLNDLIDETKINQEKYDNQLMELVNKLSLIGNKLK